MIALPIIALLLGALIAVVFQIGSAGGVFGQYLAVACLAGMDTVFGGVRSGLEGKFNQVIFFTGFVSNILIASFLAWLGDKIYLNVFFAVALVLTSRIFTNLSLIRRFMLTRWQDARERARLEKLAQSVNVSATAEGN